MDAGPPVTLAQLALSFAARELGVSEEPRGSNAGPRVNEYLRAVHMPPGVAWCAAFACWCIQQASKAMAVTPQFRYSSGALRLLGVQPELRLDGPEIGAVVVWDHGGGMGHVGLVEALGPDLLHTIEGNTNDEGSREGYEVCRRQRHVKDGRIAGYLKIC